MGTKLGLAAGTWRLGGFSLFSVYPLRYFVPSYMIVCSLLLPNLHILSRREGVAWAQATNLSCHWLCKKLFYFNNYISGHDFLLSKPRTIHKSQYLSKHYCLTLKSYFFGSLLGQVILLAFVCIPFGMNI